MGWKAVHRWVGLAGGGLAVVLGLTGALLAIDPVHQAWQAAPVAGSDLPVATLADRVQRTFPGVEEIRRLPSGAIVAYGFAGDQARAFHVDPADGRALADYRGSPLPRWVKNLHRSLLLGDPGRWGAAGIAIAMALISVSGLVLLLRRMGAWRQLAGSVRGPLVERLHVQVGRVVLVVMCVTSLSAVCMSAATLGLVTLEAGAEPDAASVPTGRPSLPAVQLAALRSVRVGDLRKLNFPAAADPQDAWKVTTETGQGWIDRYSGEMLAWQEATAAQRVNDWALALHTGESAWLWAVVLGLAGSSVLLFWITGLIIWWQDRRRQVRIVDNVPPAQADVLVFVASEGGSTWGFARTLHDALVRCGHRVHTAGLEQFRATPAARHVFVLAATYGEGQPPTHARAALGRIARHSGPTPPLALLGFGDRQYPSFCGFAQELDQALRARDWPLLLPLECIHQQSSQQFARWGEAVALALGEPLELRHEPSLPPTTALTLISRQDYPGQAGAPAAILRFAWPRPGWRDRLSASGLAPFDAGDLVGIVPPGSHVPRFYSLASGSKDGFLEICVRRLPGGLCSTYLHALEPGDTVQAFIRSNPGFALPTSRRPVVLIGAGTGVAPLAGFIRRNDRHVPMHLYYGGRDPAQDFYFESEIRRWMDEHRMTRLQTAFSRTPGGGYVQDALRRDAPRVRELLARGAVVRLCGSRPMAAGVTEVLDEILAPLQSSVRHLKAKGRYAEDLF
ncbi:PepSY domain-containing protein [Ramlibacter sp.]|uniref:PepSY domain-containing protein n=1 Tax=Ramlibacter sp. TaxID=1917967 RepID=UPI003D0D9DF1